MKKPPKNEKDIRQVGKYVPVDDEGHLVNDLKLENIQEKWRPVVDDAVEEFKKIYGDRLIAVYLRGSVAAGTAIDDVSDLDDIAVVDLPEDQIDTSWRREFHIAMMDKYPFVRALKGNVESLELVMKPGKERMFLKTQSLCVYGKDIMKDVPEVSVGPETVTHALAAKDSLEGFKNFISEHPADKDGIKRRCSNIMKRLVRTGFELVMVRDHKYTRDLYLCWQEFSKFYPEKSEEMRKVLELALYPTDDGEEITKVLDSLLTWMPQEVDKVFKK